MSTYLWQYFLKDSLAEKSKSTFIGKFSGTAKLLIKLNICEMKFLLPGSGERDERVSNRTRQYIILVIMAGSAITDFQKLPEAIHHSCCR